MENNVDVTQTIIDSQVEIIGTIKSSGAIHIEGKLDGDMLCAGDVTVGKNANIKGNLNVNSISVAGTVTGNVAAKDRIELKSSARVTGDIKSKRLAVEDGVTFVGKSEVNPSGLSSSSSADEKSTPTTASSAAATTSGRESVRGAAASEEYRERAGYHAASSSRR